MLQRQVQTLLNVSVFLSNSRKWLHSTFNIQHSQGRRILTMNSMGSSNTPQDESKRIRNHRKQVQPQPMLRLGYTIVAAGEFKSNPVTQEATYCTTVKCHQQAALSQIGGERTYPTIQPSKLATENKPTMDALKLYGGDESTREVVPLVRSAQTTVHPYANPE